MMIIMKIFFAVLIVICVIFYVMYLWDFALVLLVTVIAVPFLMLLSMLAVRKKISVELAVRDDSVTKRDNFPVQIKITNSSIFPVGKAEACIEYCNLFNGETDTFNLLLPIQPKNSQNISFQLNSKYCGKVRIKCAYINIYDLLRIFRFRTGRNISTEVTVMPEGYEISGNVYSTDRVNEESNTFSEYKSGDDPSEIFDLRGYNAGDKLNRIHWKLSSKRDEFIVKEYSLPVDIPCTLFLDLNVSLKYKLPLFDTLMEILVSVSQFMLENEYIHSVVYYNPPANCFTEKRITNTESLTETVREIIGSLYTDSVYLPAQNYLTESSGISMSSFVCITSDTDGNLPEYISENVDADLKNLIIAVTSPQIAESIAESMDINITPVLIGRVTSSIKDIEL